MSDKQFRDGYDTIFKKASKNGPILINANSFCPSDYLARMICPFAEGYNIAILKEKMTYAFLVVLQSLENKNTVVDKDFIVSDKIINKIDKTLIAGVFCQNLYDFKSVKIKQRFGEEIFIWILNNEEESKKIKLKVVKNKVVYNNKPDYNRLREKILSCCKN